MTRLRQQLLLHRRPPRLHLLLLRRPIRQRQRPIRQLSLRNPRALSPHLARRRHPRQAILTSRSNSLRQLILARLGSSPPTLQRTSGKIDSEVCRPVVAMPP